MSRTFLPHVITDDSALGGKVIERSLRFRSGSSSNLEKINSSAGNRRTMTYSFWFKRVNINFQTILRGKQGASDRHGIDLLSDGGFRFWGNAYNASPLFHIEPSRLLRDLNAWYHLVLSIDTTQSTASDRVKFYINGDLLTDFDTATYPGQNDSLYLNDACRQTWGVEDGGINIYYADIHFIDGYQYDASYFGYTESQTGIWRPKKYEGTYQDNAYHFDFSDPTSLDTLGIDKSPLGNDYAAEGFQISAGYNQDSLLDTPTKEYATLNPIHHNSRNATFINGNLYATIPASDGTAAIQAHGNMPLKSGKWYYEVLYNQAGGNGDYLYVGLSNPSYPNPSFYRSVRGSDGEQYPNTGSTEVRFTTNDIINVAVDLDVGKWYIGRNGTYWYSGDPVAGTGFVHSDLISANASTTTEGLVPFFYNATSGASQQFSVNFGQRPFSYTPPSGFKEINSSNLPLNVPSIIRPQKHFDIILYTGDEATSRKISGLEFKPDFVWIKPRSTTSNHVVLDSVRGVHNRMLPNSSNGNVNNTSTITAFNVDGFQIGNSSLLNTNGATHVAWCWKAGGDSNTFNVDDVGYASASAAGITDGSIALTAASVNREAGFSIVTYTGTGSSGTVGHGFTKTPKVVMTKSRSASGSWNLLHTVGNPTAEYGLFLNDNGGHSSYQGGTHWGDTLPTSTVFTVNSNASTNASGVTYVAYCWAEIPGYSKFGIYEATNNTDGPYVHLGFQPKWVMMKPVDSSGNWQIYDTSRTPINKDDGNGLYPDLSNSEASGFTMFDFLSTGFKNRNSGSGGINYSGTYIYMAFAEQPRETPFGINSNAR